MTPEQLHNAYTAQVSPFLAALPDPGLRTLFRQQGDPFFRRCALALWQAGGAPLTPAHGGWYNALYTGSKPQETLFWDMVSQGEETLPADHVVLAVGFTPRPSLAGELAGTGMEVYQVGDGSKVGSVMTAIASAYTVARAL